jgi:GNAT superfamily N-acetyltransferase
MLIRRARDDDAAAVAYIAATTWRSSYRGLLPDHVLDGIDTAEWTVARRRWLESRDDFGIEAFVVERTGSDGADEPDDPADEPDDPAAGPVGFVFIGPERVDGEATDRGQVYALYMLPASQGHGYGRALLEAGEAELLRRGHRHAVLWVLRHNDRSRAFYERCGWTADGAGRVEELFGALTDEVRYVRRLGEG